MSQPVKNQYYGDERDHLKYSLLLALAQDLSLPTVTAIWMLTSDDGSSEGCTRSAIHDDLAVHLAQPPPEGAVPRCRDIAPFFEHHGLRFVSYRDDQTDFGIGRALYFAGIPSDVLRDAVVFFDPDNGMEPASGAGRVHLAFAELRSVLERMNNRSVAVVFQYQRHVHDFWNTMSSDLSAATKRAVAYAASASVGFYVISADETRHARCLESVESLKATYAAASGKGFQVGQSIGPAA